jgi:hypothetical protein
VISALPRSPAPLGNQGGQTAVRGAVRRQQHQLGAVAKPHLGADDEPDTALLRGEMRAHDPGQRALVGEGNRRVAELRRLEHQLLRVGGALQEAEIGQAVQLGVAGRGLGGHGVTGILCLHTVYPPPKLVPGTI